jgi:hypothetical protein
VHTDLDGGEKCGGHCIHVGFMWRDFKRMEKAFWFLFAAVIGLVVADVYPKVTSRGREETAAIHGGERLATDRIEPAR